MIRAGARLGVVAIVVGVTQTTGVDAAPDCLDWNLPHYFEMAEARDVVACLETGGASVEDPSELSLSTFLRDPLASEESDAQLHANDGDHATPLHLAAGFSARPDVLQTLIGHGAALSTRDASGATPLHWAAALTKNPGIVDILLDAGADKSQLDASGEFAWNLAKTWNRYLRGTETLDRLRPTGCSARIEDDQCQGWGSAEFFRAADPETVAQCLRSGADLDARFNVGWTPLHLAAAFSPHPEAIDVLLDAGADKGMRTDSGALPVQLGERNRSVAGTDVMNRLRPSDCDAWMSIGFFASASPQEVTACLERGADVNARSQSGWTPFHLAAGFNPDPRVLTVLAAAGADTDSTAESGMRPLHTAARHNRNPDVVDAVIRLGADVNALSDGERTALHEAALSSKAPDTVRALIATGIDIRAETATGRIAHDLAVENAVLRADEDLMRELRPQNCDDWLSLLFFRFAAPSEVQRCLERGRDPNERSARGWTPLHLAAGYSASWQIVEMLLANGASPASSAGSGLTPLHLAARGATDPEIISVIVDAGVSPNIKTESGWTPLHLAAEKSGTPEIIVALVRECADIASITAEGLTPWDLVQRNEMLRFSPVSRLLFTDR